MRLGLLTTLAALLLTTVSSAGSALKVGDRVMGRFQSANYWYPATVKAIEGADISLSYDDGSEETVDESRIRPLGWNKEMPIECQIGESWARGKVTKQDGKTISLKDETDGSSKDSPLAKCRTEYPLDSAEEVARKAEADKMMQMMNKPKVRVDETKVDCAKAAEITKDEAAAYDANPLAAIMKKADKMCTYAQEVFQQAKKSDKLPAKSGFKDVSQGHVLNVVTSWWAGGSDADFVKVVGARVTGTKWMTTTMSDAPGVPYARTLGVASSYKYKDACYLIYGAIEQKNVNHPNALVPPDWSGSEYRATNYQGAQKIDCKKAGGL